MVHNALSIDENEAYGELNPISAILVSFFCGLCTKISEIMINLSKPKIIDRQLIPSSVSTVKNAELKTETENSGIPRN